MDSEHQDKPARLKIKKSMRQKKYFIPHAMIVFLEIIAVGAVLAAAGAGFLAWRLAQGPVDLGFARDYIEEALRNPETGISVEFEDVALSWPKQSGPLLIGFKNTKLIDKNGKPFAFVDEAAIGFSKRRLIFGRISPTVLILKEPALQVVRTKTGGMRIGVADPDAYGPQPPQTGGNQNDFILSVLSHLANTTDEERENLPMRDLRVLRVEGARLLIEDEVRGNFWMMPRLDMEIQNLRRGLNVLADIKLPSDQAENRFLKLEMTAPRGENGTARLTLKGFDPWFFAQGFSGLENMARGAVLLDGAASMTLAPDFKPLNATFRLSSAQGTIPVSAYVEKPLSYNNLSIGGAYDSATGMLTLDDTSFDMRGLKVIAESEIKFAPQSITGPLRLKIDRLEQKKLAALWPPKFSADNSAEWLVRRMSDGVFKDLSATVNLDGKNTDGFWSFAVNDIRTAFAFEGMTVNYRYPLMPVKSGSGVGEFIVDQERLNIKISGGKIGDMNITGGQLEFANILEAGKGKADIHVKLNGPLKTAFDYVAAEPISMKRRFDPARLRGEADLAVNINFPTHPNLKVDEVKIKLRGALSNVLLPSVVGPLDLSGGPLDIRVEGNSLKVSGNANLGNSAGSFAYDEFLNSAGQPYASRVNADMNATPESRLALIGPALEDFISGPAKTRVIYTEQKNGDGAAEINADLSSAGLRFSPLNYAKPPGRQASASAALVIEKGAVRAVKNLSITAPDLAVRNGLIEFTGTKGAEKLSAIKTPDFKIGKSQGAVTLKADSGDTLNIDVNAKVFDIAPVVGPRPEKPSAYDGPRIVLSLKTPVMLGADGARLPDARIDFTRDTLGRFETMSLATRAGGSPVSLNLRPNPQNPRAKKITVSAENAGAALAAFGIYEDVRGGVLSIDGHSMSDNTMIGQATMTDFKVVKAPTLARLVSALSLPGLTALLQNEGLAFTRLRADYDWQWRPEGARLSIKDGRTSGNSIGFTFEGPIDLAAQDMNITGTAIPLSGVNKFISKIPLVGEILTGGSGVIAATYSIRGETSEPKVGVNPLSVLAPGILRKILFE